MKKVIVIGSGISGMTCACALANKNYDVTVFEKHKVYGGYCQNFVRKGFRFGAAVHRIGGIYAKQNIDNIMSELGVKTSIEWYKFKERVQVGDIGINMCNTNIADMLEKMYPNEKEDINNFRNEISKINNLLNIIDEGSNKGVEKFTISDLLLLKKYRKMSIDEFLNGIFKNEEIVSILVAVSDAMPGGSVFAFTRMIAFANCGEETYQPIGGAMRIIDLLAERIKELGGKIELDSQVDKIIVEDGKAVGVICKGIKYYSDYVISDCDIQLTINKLIGIEYVNSRLLDKINNKFEESPSCVSVWVGLDTDIETLGYEPINLSYYPNKRSALEDKRRLISSNSVQRENDFLLISLSANQDKSASPTKKGQMMMGMLVNWDFENLVEIRKNDPVAYRKKKEEIAGILIQKAERFFPHIHEHIEVMEIASPATFERYTGNSKGAFGGYKCTPELVENYSLIDGKQIVRNLFVTGHWGGVGDGVIFTTDVAMRVADKVIRCDKRSDYYDFNKKYAQEG